MFSARDKEAQSINWNVIDKKINVKIGQTLVRRGIDSNKLNYSSSHGSILVTGFMCSMSSQEISSGGKMQSIEKEIRKIQYVQSVKWKLQNWEHREGKWIKKKMIGSNQPTVIAQQIET